MIIKYLYGTDSMLPLHSPSLASRTEFVYTKNATSKLPFKFI